MYCRGGRFWHYGPWDTRVSGLLTLDGLDWAQPERRQLKQTMLPQIKVTGPSHASWGALSITPGCFSGRSSENELLAKAEYVACNFGQSKERGDSEGGSLGTIQHMSKTSCQIHARG